MRAWAVLVAATAVFAECLAASNRPRQRSGPIRSVPVAADVKRDVDFDCPEEFGYYPHPTDCSLYYVCVFGGALLESCTGGLMYSHELQTCDWPRNVGCDGSSAVGGDEFERLNEREPPPPPRPSHRRTPPPPQPRAQPNPVITSRGQPKFNRDEYEKQQQLYAEVDDLPPVEEIESDRQQRVYRGQPSTIGQVQKDRDGYSGQVNSGRNFNSNIIPASIPQNGGKIGSFSFGSQVDDRRTITQAPQTYNEDKLLTDSKSDRLLDVDTNKIEDLTKQPILTRKKRDVLVTDTNKNDTTHNVTTARISEKSDTDDFLDYYQIITNNDEDEGRDHGDNNNDTERGKRQIGFYAKNGYQTPSKNWSILKPIKLFEIPQSSYRQNLQSNRYYHNDAHNYYDDNRRPHSLESHSYSTANPFLAYQSGSFQAQNPFKASLPDYTSPKHGHSQNIATHIITKSPPISALRDNSNQFRPINGGFYNSGAQTHGNNQFTSQGSLGNRPFSPIAFKDSSLLPSTVVTGKPVPMPTSKNLQSYDQQRPNNDHEDDNDSEEEDESSEEDDEEFSHSYPKPPYEFTHPRNKYAEIENPFASPNFDFDEYLAKLSNGQYTTHNPKIQSSAIKSTHRPFESSTTTQQSYKSSTLNYKGMSTPRPFSIIPTDSASTSRPAGHFQHTPKELKEQYVQKLQPNQQTNQQQQLNSNTNKYNQQQYSSQYNVPQQSSGISFDPNRPKLKPPNFNDDRQLPISYSFTRPIDFTSKPNSLQKFNSSPQPLYSTSKPHLFLTPTGQPLILSSTKANNIVKNEKLVSQQPYQAANGKQYFSGYTGPINNYSTPKPSTSKPLTTLANEQLSALQHFWKSTTESILSPQSITVRPVTTPDVERLKSLFAQAVKTSMQTPVDSQATNIPKYTTTTKAPKRRPIPKPSPEMNDYYYDDDDYYEPPVKSQYMPSTEVRPQRPMMAQNDKEYDDSYEYSGEEVVNIRPKPTKIPKLTFKTETLTKNYNDVSIVTKSPLNNYHHDGNKKFHVPVLLDFVSPTPTVLIRPQIGNFEIVQGSILNVTGHIKRPTHEIGPNTLKPPKYLNQTTLRPYTVRHRLAKPTNGLEPTTQKVERVTNGRGRHPNIVAQMLTTPRDSQNQETRATKSKYDGTTNSLEPTESVAPVSYSPSPRPKMLYNGSQNYSPEQYDPFYAIYDEDGELYKDTDYVQQYNVASVRPAVQQTYRGTPPPTRRPVDNYTPRPFSDDYDDALIQGQINLRNENQYQSAVRQSTRGEGNELGYEHIPSSVRTTIYETTISTVPPTTSTSTTQRTTTAQFTEAMTPSRYTPRSSTDENPIPKSEISSNRNSSEGSVSSFPSTPSPVINFSSRAKPFKNTDNLHGLEETVPTTEELPLRQTHVTNNNNNRSVKVVHLDPNQMNKKYVSLTTGFSIRRNSSNTNNPYTLTVLTRPLDDFDRSNKNKPSETNSRNNPNRYFYNSNTEGSSIPVKSEFDSNHYDGSSENPMRRKDSRLELNDEYDISVEIRPTMKSRTKQSKVKSTPPATSTTKYYIKSVIKRPAPFSKDENDHNHDDISENAVSNVHTLIDTGLQNVRNHVDISSTTNKIIEITPKREYSDRSQNNRWSQPTAPSYITLDNSRNYESLIHESSTSTTSTTPFTTTTSTTTERYNQRFKPRDNNRSKPYYYSYKVDDIDVPDTTTEVFGSNVKNVIKAFFSSFASTPSPQEYPSTYRTTTTTQRVETSVVNIGYKKPVKFNTDDKPLRQNIQHVRIITEPNFNQDNTQNEHIPSDDSDSIKDFADIEDVEEPSKGVSSTAMTPNTIPTYILSEPETTPLQKSVDVVQSFPVYNDDSYQGKYSSFITSTPKVTSTTHPVVEPSRKFQHFIKVDSPQESSKAGARDSGASLGQRNLQITTTSKSELYIPSDEEIGEIASTTSTTKSTTTTTVKIDPTTTKATTKSVSFPTRASRINPAIKLAATNPGSGRRSYQSSSKCSSDNSLQANPKCNEIKYQRPTSTRGRGSAHYSTSGGSDAPQPVPNRGTPPTRSRPTLKPSTAIVSKTVDFVDIYNHPPSRPAPVYPQPTPDKTAAKCRKDVCLLPDCYCGGKDIPGELPLEQVPQIVLLTFDDSVNDLNKGLYMDLFEKGRVNPNGCPISATFYVSHEWTDYSQVQNLYAAGHEMASHTVSHSFGEQFSQKKWNREVGGQREILAAYGGVKLEDVRGMRAPFLSIGGNKMFKMLYDSNFTYDSSMPVYENRPPSWPYTLDYKLFHDCMIPPCPTKSYPGVWEVPMVMWQDLNGGRCSMGDACANPPEAEGVYKMLLKNFDRHYTTNRAPFGLYYHAAWFTQPHHKEGFIMFLDFINRMQDVWIVTNWQALQWVRDPTPISRMNSFQPFQCNYQDRPKKCNNPKVCNLWHKSGVRYMRTCQPCPEIYPWTGKSGIRSSRIDNDNGE